MYPEVKTFLQNNRIAVVSIVDLEGYPHGATLHYATDGDSIELYFRTDKNSHKVENLIHGETGKASVVIGFSEKEWLTLQMEGTIHIAMVAQEQQRAEIAYFNKFPTSEKGGHTVILIFKPLFWKFTDYSKKPWKIITSEDK